MNENAAVKVILEEYRKVVEELQKERLDNKLKVKMLKEDIVSKYKEIDQLKYDINIKDERLEVMSNDVKRLEYNENRLSSIIDERLEDLKKKEEKIKKLESKCKTAGMMIDDLQEENKKLNKDNVLLTDKSKRYEMLYSNVDIDMKRLEQKNRDLKSQLIKLSINKIQTDSTLTKLETVNEKVKEHIDVMCDKLDKVMTDDDKKYLEELKVKYPNYKYIARDRSGSLFIHQIMPIKYRTIWAQQQLFTIPPSMQLNKDKLSFIKWEDKEPYEIN